MAALRSRRDKIVCGGPGRWSKRYDAYEFRTIRGVRKYTGGKGFVLLDR